MDSREQIIQLEERVRSLESLVLSLTTPSDLTPDVRRAFELALAGVVAGSSKGSTTENQTVDEGGASTYSVLKAPDGFDQAIVDGTTHYYPFFT